MISKDYFKELWNEYFYISDSSPSGLCWKVGRKNGKTVPGSSAGYVSNSGHWKVELKGKSLQVHRVIYYLANGVVDEGMVVDHFDRDPTNNSIDNLRLVSFEVNMRNKKLAKSSKTLKTGVYERHEFVANWVEGGKLKHKAFSVQQYGDSAFELAKQYRDAQISKLNALEYGYSEGHGTS